MLSHKLQVKFFVDRPNGLKLSSFIPVFHDWIKNDTLGELLIDVADYGHVSQGPGVLLVGHGSDYYLDVADGRLGLLYSRKRDAPADPLKDAVRRALVACRQLENEPELRVRFVAGELLLRINDRLRAPNTHETFQAVRPELEDLLGQLYAGEGFDLEPLGRPRELFGVRVKSDSKASLGDLLARLG